MERKFSLWHDLGQKFSLWRDLESGSAGASSSSGPRALLLQESERPRQISEHIYEIRNDRPEQWSAEIVCFHGLEHEDSSDPHISTWLSRNKKELWLNWLQKEFPNVRILTVRYDASLVKTYDQGLLDSYLTSENLLGELTGKRGGSVGEAQCPIILVGHCLGGLVLKACLLMAAKELGSREDSQSIEHFLWNVKGVLYYASPHHGSELPDRSIWYPRGSLFKDLGLLNTETARRNANFQQLRRKYKWRSVGVGAVRPVTLNRFNGLVAAEASSRYDVDDYYSVHDDHLNVSRPESTRSRNFTVLAELIDFCIKKEEGLKPVSSNLPKNTVGLQDRIQEIRQKLQTETRIAIVGMGGVGKTTLALAVYENIAKEFQYSCFLEEVKLCMTERETPQNLREKITGKLVDRRRCSVSKSFKWNDLQGKKVLIILDDAEFEAQVKVMTEKDGFSLQSRVLITARDKGFIQETDLGFHIHDMEGLGYDVSKELFCLYAFQQNEPPVGSSKHVRDIVGKCGGLPLALTVLGKYLSRYPQNKAVWEDAYGRLRDAKPLNGKEGNDGLWSRLKPSYELLGPDEKEMFLDVATCFHGERLEEIQKVWRACRETPDIAWRNLLDLHLVSENTTQSTHDVRVHVHEVLRDLGRNLAGCSRMSAYNLQDVAKLSYEDARRVKVVKGWPRLFPHGLAKFTKLQILWLDDAFDYADHRSWIYNVSGMDDSSSFDGFGFAEMVCCKVRCVTSAIQLKVILRSKSLRYLSIGGACGGGFPNTLWAEFHNFQELQYLEMSSWMLNAISKGISKLGRLQCLTIAGCPCVLKEEKLDSPLARCRPFEMTVLDRRIKPGSALHMFQCRVTAIPEEIKELQGLQSLTISGCKDLQVVPKVIGKLQMLQSLTIAQCPSLEMIPTEIGRLINLESLEISDCDRVRAIPEEIKELQGLQSLTISGCQRLQVIAKGIDKLQMLQSLTIARCLSLEMIPTEIGRLTNLQSLEISRCHRVRAIPEEIKELQGLKSLALTRCSHLRAIPNGIGKLEGLLSLSIDSCSRLEVIPTEISELTNLEVLDICNCSERVQLSLIVIGQLRNLKSLRVPIYDTPKVTPARIGDKLQNPLKLSQALDSCYVDLIANFADAGKFHRLESIDIVHYVDVLVTGKEGEELESPYNFDLFWNFDVKAIPARLNQLRSSKLKISYQVKVGRITVSHFKLVQMSLTRDYSGIAPREYSGIVPREIIAKSCGDFTMISEGIPKYPLYGVTSLTLSSCNMEVIPSGIIHLYFLEELIVYDCPKLKAIPSEVSELLSLKSLKIAGCEELKAIPSDGGNLRLSASSVKIAQCPKLLIPEETLERFCHEGRSIDIWTEDRLFHYPKPVESRREI